MNRFAMLGLLAVMAGLPTLAQSQGVWRCGADGRSFSDRPCSDGQPLQRAALADLRSADELRAAQVVAARERRLADGLRQQRLERERASAPPAYRDAAVRRHEGRTAFSPKVQAKKEQPPPASRRAIAAAGIWPATAPASRRAKD
ncbi:MAG TPA: hypothetical protein VLM87_01880 [Rubrivivax sp.]|nr:hypothetical protein [Rubrivivax sp.]